MTHLALIVTALLLFLADDFAAARDVTFNAAPHATPGPGLGLPALAAIVWLPKLAVIAWAVWRGRVAAARLGGPRTQRAYAGFNRLTTALPLIAAALFALDLWAGALVRVREQVGNLVLIDECAVWLPTLGMLLAGHAARYPVERRLRESQLIRRADRGLPLHPVPGPAAWILGRARQDLGLLLVPLLMLMGWGEAVLQLTESGRIGPALGLWLGPVGTVVVLVFAPVAIRHALDTTPLSAGVLRDNLLTQCGQHRVRVRELLVWRTHGSTLNAAVTGLIPQTRYILLTDALIEELPPAQLHAVMEHELNHARHRHLPTLLMVAAALLTALTAAGEGLVQHLAPLLRGGRSLWLDGVVAAASLGLGAAAFGWASRRLERQADTPRVPGFSPEPETETESETVSAPAAPHPPIYTATDIYPMLAALGQVAAHAHLNPRRFSWRHGSIHWRQTYLRGLVGTPVAAATIHHVVRRIQIAAVLLLTAGVAALWWMPLA